MEIKYTTSDPELADLLKSVGISCNLEEQTDTTDYDAEERDRVALANSVKQNLQSEVPTQVSTSDLDVYLTLHSAGLQPIWTGNPEDLNQIEL